MEDESRHLLSRGRCTNPCSYGAGVHCKHVVKKGLRIKPCYLAWHVQESGPVKDKSMLKLHKNDALAISQLAGKAKKKIPLYEFSKSLDVRVPFLDLTTNKQRYLRFFRFEHGWRFTEVVD